MVVDIISIASIWQGLLNPSWREQRLQVLNKCMGDAEPSCLYFIRSFAHFLSFFFAPSSRGMNLVGLDLPPLLNTTFGTHCHNWLNNLTPCHKDLTFTYKPIQQYPHRAQIAGSCTETWRKRASEWRTSVLTFLMSVSPRGEGLCREMAGRGACLLTTLLWTEFMAYLHKQIWAEWMAEALCLVINMRANSVQCKPIESVLKASYPSPIV